MYHYVYRLDHIETGEFYIGSRTSKVHPSQDSYLGSMVTWKPDKTKLIKIIVKDAFANRTDAIIFEAEEISKFIKEPLNKNYHIPHKGYHTVGQVTVKDKYGKTFNVDKYDPRYINIELVGCTKGRSTVKDKDGKIFNVDKDDPRYLNGELVGCTKGQVTVKDKDGKTFNVAKDDPRYLNGELISPNKGRVLVKDKNEKSFMVSVKDPRYLSGEFVSCTSFRSKEYIKKFKNTLKSICHQQGEKNSQFGTCWITNKLENKKIKKELAQQYIEIGWIFGRSGNHSNQYTKKIKNL